MKYPKRSHYKYAKSRSRVRNWRKYEAGLRKRGDLTVWLSDDAFDSWRVPPSGKPGGQRTYANIAIEAALTIPLVFHLRLRQTEGFLRSLVQMLELTIPVPDHTTLSRRFKELGELSLRLVEGNRPLHLLIRQYGCQNPRRSSAKTAEAEGLAKAASRRQRRPRRDRSLGSDISSNA